MSELKIGWYNKKGQEISVEEYEQTFWNKEYRIIKQQKVGEYFVSTVWLGLDHNQFSFLADCIDKRPIIFETMIFHDKNTIYMERYCTEEEALFGHEEAVKQAEEWVKKGTYE